MGFFNKTKKNNDNKPASVLPNAVGAYTPRSNANNFDYNQNQNGIADQSNQFQPNLSQNPFEDSNTINNNFQPADPFGDNTTSGVSESTQSINTVDSNFDMKQNNQSMGPLPPFQRPERNSIDNSNIEQSTQFDNSFLNNENLPTAASNNNVKLVPNTPSQNQMPQRNYTQNKNHMVPINKVFTSEENSPTTTPAQKPNLVKEVFANMIPFGLGKKFSEYSNTETTDEDLSIVDEGSISVQDFIAPSAIEVDFNEMRIGNKFVRTIFAIDYKFSNPGMLEQIVNYEEALDVSMFYYPINSGEIVKKLRQKISEFEASLNLDLERGRVPDAYIKVSLQDAIRQQELLASGIEKWFNFALYITIKADTVKELNNMTQALLSILASKEISAKTASLAMEKAFQSTMPAGIDKLFKVRNMDTTSIANTFPFTSSDLSMDKGIMYGINTYNRSLVIFDRFAMPNANMVVFATSGAGKSFMVKLEAVRSLMLGTEVIVIDPENEYQNLAKSIGGAYISFSQDGANKVNPFELSGIVDSNEDELKLKELSLIGFFKLAFGDLTNSELAILERAIRQAYFEKGITNNPATHKLEAPRMEDLYKVFKAGIEPEAAGLADRLEKFIIGSASGIFDRKTNVDLTNPFTVFSIRDLSDELKPLAMYFMMDLIWNRVKKDPRKRILVVDEAWLLMRYPESALFINSIAKRARKYYLGLTVISQNVEDFLQSDIGVAVVTNSSIQVLLKQHPTAIDKLQKVFYLSDGEKNLLLGASVGMGLFFADNNHVAIEIKASDQEYKLCSTKPQDVHDKKEEVVVQEPNQRSVPNSLI